MSDAKVNSTKNATAYAWLLSLVMLVPATSLAETLACRKHDPLDPRPRIGLVLGGGGARGIAHVSVIKALERQHIPIDCIAGTSMGSLIGGLYASGMSIQDIEKLVTTLNWPETFNDDLARPDRSYRRKRDDVLSLLPAKPGIDTSGVKLSSGLIAGETIMLLLERLTNEASRSEDFDHLVIPFRAVATDINSGQAYVMKSGSLARSMRASMSIPGVFRAIEIDGHVLVDGGIVNQVPVDVVRAMGADIVIAVDVGTPLEKLDENSSILAFAGQLGGLMTVGNTVKSIESLGPQDLLIAPALGTQVATGDFDKAALALKIGDEAMLVVQPQLAALARPDYDKNNQRRMAADARIEKNTPVIEFVKLDNKTTYSDASLLARLDIAINENFDATKIDTSIKRLYGLTTLDLVTYKMVEDNGKTGLLVEVKPKSFGPNYLETGANLYADFKGEFIINLRAGVIRNPINDLGGEFRVLAQIGSEPGILFDYYQPLDPAGHYFAGVLGGFANPQLSVFSPNGDRLAEYAVPTLSLNPYFGRTFSDYGAATVGLLKSTGEANLLVGADNLPNETFDVGNVYWDFTIDRMDNLQLPTNGVIMSVGQTFGREALGSATDFDQFNFDGAYARPIGLHSIFAGLRYHDTTSGTPELQNQFRLGGITRLVGYTPNSIFTPNYALAYVGYTYEVGRLLGKQVIFGGTLEYAELWNGGPNNTQGNTNEFNASGYFGFNSWLGRFLIGYGFRENGEGTAFIELGRNR